MAGALVVCSATRLARDCSGRTGPVRGGSAGRIVRPVQGFVTLGEVLSHGPVGVFSLETVGRPQAVAAIGQGRLGLAGLDTVHSAMARGPLAGRLAGPIGLRMCSAMGVGRGGEAAPVAPAGGGRAEVDVS